MPYLAKGSAMHNFKHSQLLETLPSDGVRRSVQEPDEHIYWDEGLSYTMQVARHWW